LSQKVVIWQILITVCSLFEPESLFK